MYEMIKEFIKPELLVLIPVLYMFGSALKNSQINNKHIPWLLGAFSVILSVMFIFATSEVEGTKATLISIFSGITQGILCAGASVYVNQLVKQASKDE